MGDCQKEYDAYQSYAILSIVLTLAVMGYSRKQNNFTSNPVKGIKFFSAFGVIKIIIGILLLTVLHPDCTGFVGTGSYGFIAIAIGVLWIHGAWRLSNAPVQDVRSGSSSEPSTAYSHMEGKTNSDGDDFIHVQNDACIA